MEHFDLTPDPKVLIALTHTPLKVLDALCELIDNSIDSFHLASLKGEPTNNPLIIIDIPTPSDLSNNNCNYCSFSFFRFRFNVSMMSKNNLPAQT